MGTRAALVRPTARYDENLRSRVVPTSTGSRPIVALFPRRRLVPLVLLLITAQAFLAGGVEAQQTGSITGRVIDNQSQQPLGVAQLRVEGIDVAAFTDSDGTYTIQNVPVGTHTVIVEVIGYTDESRQVTVAAGQTVVTDFSLNTEALALD